MEIFRIYIVLILVCCWTFEVNAYSKNWNCKKKLIESHKLINLAKEIKEKNSGFEGQRFLAQSYLLASVWSKIKYCSNDVVQNKVPRFEFELSYLDIFLVWSVFNRNPNIRAAHNNHPIELGGVIDAPLVKPKSIITKKNEFWNKRKLAPIINKSMLEKGLVELLVLKKKYPFNGDSKKSWSYVDNLTLGWVYEYLNKLQQSAKYYSANYIDSDGRKSGLIECYRPRLCDKKKLVLEAYSNLIRVYSKLGDDTRRDKAKQAMIEYDKSTKYTRSHIIP